MDTTLDPDITAASFPQMCSIEGCSNASKARTSCVKHYSRWRRHGDPLVGGRPARVIPTVEETVAECRATWEALDAYLRAKAGAEAGTR
jgi:hypothetical protein